MNHIFQTSVLIIGCIELNWLCKYMKKVRSSQRAIPVLSWVKHQSFPVSIVKDRKCFWIFDFLLWHSANEKHLPSQLPVELFALKNCYRALLFAWYWYKKIFTQITNVFNLPLNKLPVFSGASIYKKFQNAFKLESENYKTHRGPCFYRKKRVQ